MLRDYCLDINATCRDDVALQKKALGLAKAKCKILGGDTQNVFTNQMKVSCAQLLNFVMVFWLANILLSLKPY